MGKTSRIHRSGMGTAEAVISREDIDAQLSASFHYAPISKLDIYAKIGAGVGVMNYIIRKIHNETGFYDKVSPGGARHKYSYRDLDHVKWKDIDSRAVPAISLFVGATYYFLENWGAELQVGLLNANFKDKDKGYPHSYGICSVGVAYKF